MATCLVIMKNEYMRTTTNIYLFNLAITDLATLLFAMPSELYLMWRQYPWTFGEVIFFKDREGGGNRERDRQRDREREGGRENKVWEGQ